MGGWPIYNFPAGIGIVGTYFGLIKARKKVNITVLNKNISLHQYFVLWCEQANKV